jgi:hypothetical protein
MGELEMKKAHHIKGFRIVRKREEKNQGNPIFRFNTNSDLQKVLGCFTFSFRFHVKLFALSPFLEHSFQLFLPFLTFDKKKANGSGKLENLQSKKLLNCRKVFPICGSH